MSFFNVISRIDPISALIGGAAGAVTAGVPLGWYAYKKRKECKTLSESIARAEAAINAAKAIGSEQPQPAPSAEVSAQQAPSSNATPQASQQEKKDKGKGNADNGNNNPV